MPGIEKEQENIWVLAGDGKLGQVEQHIKLDPTLTNIKDENGYSPLHAAVSYSHEDLVLLLIEYGADVNIQDNDGDTPLHLVENLQVCIILCENGADPNTRNLDGLMPIELAHLEGRSEIVQYLVQFTPNYIEYDPVDEDGELTAEQLQQLQYLLDMQTSEE